jgi:rifampicin phosphotransferase
LPSGQEQPEGFNPLHSHSDPGIHWTTSNVGEAIPGVMTPLCSSIWVWGGERGLRRVCYALGILDRFELAQPSRVEDLWVRPFYGRIAMQVEFMALVGDRMPGTSGEEAVSSLFGRIPDGMSFQPTRARYPAIAYRVPAVFAAFPAKLRGVAHSYDVWWRQSVDRLESLDRDGALALLAEAQNRFNEAEHVQTLGVLGVVQPMFDALTRLVELAGVGDVATLSGSGGAELAVVGDIWRASRGQLGVEDVVRCHGFHGPHEGEPSSVVWREDDEPLRRMVELYAQRPDEDDPLRIESRRQPERSAMEREVLAALPPFRRPSARVLLALARQRIPMRGVAKRSFLQALDVVRGAARRAGEQLCRDGVLDLADDTFYLTMAELRGPLPADARSLVAQRREWRAAYQELSLPRDWTGMPEPIRPADGQADGRAVSLTGIGVSPGVAEGIARVVTNPDFADVEPDEILVASTTDPSWSSIMFVSSALVMDIGGPLSHAAVVARELQIPCVVNTVNGTSAIATGDRIRVDGAAGTIEIVARASPS